MKVYVHVLLYLVPITPCQLDNIMMLSCFTCLVSYSLSGLNSDLIQKPH